MVQNRQKLRLTPLLFGEIWSFWVFFQSSFSREIYVQWSTNQDKNAFQGLKKLFRAILKNLKNGPKSSKS